LLEAKFGVGLHALQLHLELLVLMLELFDGAGELAQRILDAVDTRADTGAVGLGNLRRLRRRLLSRLGLLRSRLAAMEQVVEKSARALVLRHARARRQQHGEGGKRR
jgi:hypothetical protein